MATNDPQDLSNGIPPFMFGGPQPGFYANGYSVNTSAVDVGIVWLHGPIPQCVLTMPLSVAKSLAAQLKTAIDDYEAKLGQPLPTLQELDERINGKRS